MACPHPIENIMRTTMEQLKEMVGVNTIVGDPVLASDGTMIIPISTVSTGFISGGGEYGAASPAKRQKDDSAMLEEGRHPFAGASAAGISLTPTSFIVIGNGAVKVVPAQYNCTVDRIIEMLPRAMEEFRKLASTFGCGKKKPKTEEMDQPFFDE